MGPGPNYNQTRSRLYYIPKVSKFTCSQACKWHLFPVNLYFTEQNKMQIGD